MQRLQLFYQFPSLPFRTKRINVLIFIALFLLFLTVENILLFRFNQFLLHFPPKSHMGFVSFLANNWADLSVELLRTIIDLLIITQLLKLYHLSWRDIGFSFASKKRIATWSILLLILLLPNIKLFVSTGWPLMSKLPDYELFKLLSNVFFDGLLGPFIEEILFRGIFFTLLRSRTSVFNAWIVQALVFGIAHLQASILQSHTFPIGNAFAFGLWTGLGVLGSGSLIPGLLTHIVNNTTSEIFRAVPIN